MSYTYASLLDTLFSMIFPYIVSILSLLFKLIIIFSPSFKIDKYLLSVRCIYKILFSFIAILCILFTLLGMLFMGIYSLLSLSPNIDFPLFIIKHEVPCIICIISLIYDLLYWGKFVLAFLRLNYKK